jgi:hypothetical protein
MDPLEYVAAAKTAFQNTGFAYWLMLYTGQNLVVEMIFE